jgi:hypothetical protein
MPRVRRKENAPQFADVWQEVLAAAQPEINPLSFKTWLGPTRLLPSSNGKLRISVPNLEFKEWIEEHHGTTLLKAAKQKGFPKIEFYPEIAEPAPAFEVEEPEERSPQPELLSLGVPVLPEAAWPEAALQYREAIARTTNAPDSFHLGSFLAGIGAALGRRVWTTVSEPIFPSMFMVLVGSSGLSRKGTAMKKAMRIIEAANLPLEVLRSLDTAEGLVRSLLPAQGKDIEQQARRPVIFHMSELRTFLNKAGKKGLENVIPKLCEALDGDKLESNSIMSPGVIPEPFVAAVAGSSKPYVKAFRRDDLEGGLGRRMIFVYGEPKRRIAKPPRPAEPHYSNTVAAVRSAVRFWIDNGPYEMDLTPAADKQWVGFFEEELPKYLPEDEFLQTIGNGADHACMKVALIAAALDRSRKIDLKHILAGVAFAKYAVDCLRFVFDEYDVPRWVRDERKILEAVQKRPKGIRRRRLQQNFKRLGAEEFNRHVRALIESRLVRQDFDERGGAVLWYVEE